MIHTFVECVGWGAIMFLAYNAAWYVTYSFLKGRDESKKH